MIESNTTKKDKRLIGQPATFLSRTAKKNLFRFKRKMEAIEYSLDLVPCKVVNTYELRNNLNELRADVQHLNAMLARMEDKADKVL